MRQDELFMASVAFGFIALSAVVAFTDPYPVPQIVRQAPAQLVAFVGEPGHPEAIVIKPAMADSARICAEPVSGTLACRSVGDFRAWVTKRGAQ